MRTVVLVVACALLAACSSGTTDPAGDPRTVPNTTATVSPSSPETTTSAPLNAPQAGAPIAEVIRWIEAGKPADVAAYHSATRDGVTTRLETDVAFASPSGKTSCMTDVHFGGALACLVDLADPPAQPADVYGQWQGGWVDFEGDTVKIGSAHGDPGRFGNGTGQELPYGQTLAFGDYRCRADQSGVYCVNYAHQTAVRFVDSGIQTFGCLVRVTPPPTDVGDEFSC